MSPDEPVERRAAEKVVDDTAVHPITVTLVQPAIGGGASVPVPTGTVLRTPDGQPNLVVKAVLPVVAIFIRFGNSYLSALVGLVGLGLTTDAIPAADFLHLVAKSAGYAVVMPAFGVLKDLVTIFGDLEKKYPLLTGKV